MGDESKNGGYPFPQVLNYFSFFFSHLTHTHILETSSMTPESLVR